MWGRPVPALLTSCYRAIIGKGTCDQWLTERHSRGFYHVRRRIYQLCFSGDLAILTCQHPPHACKGGRETTDMQLSAGMRHARMTLSPIARHISLLSHISTISKSRSLRALTSPHRSSALPSFVLVSMTSSLHCKGQKSMDCIPIDLVRVAEYRCYGALVRQVQLLAKMSADRS